MAKAPIPVDIKTSSGMPDVWKSFRSEMDRLFDRFGMPSFPSLFEPRLGGVNVPAVEISEDDKTYKVVAELPGMDEKDVEVTVDDDMLTIHGEKRHEKEEKGKNTYVSERAYGAFERAFTLPGAVDRDKVAADFSKGILTVTLPKSAAAQKNHKKVEIKAH